MAIFAVSLNHPVSLESFSSTHYRRTPLDHYNGLSPATKPSVSNQWSITKHCVLASSIKWTCDGRGVTLPALIHTTSNALLNSQLDSICVGFAMSQILLMSSSRHFISTVLHHITTATDVGCWVITNSHLTWF